MSRSVCPACSAEGARGDQCDACGATYEANELKDPVSKLNPEIPVEIRETDHLFFRLDLLQDDLETHAASRRSTWKPNVRAMTQNWLNMGLRPRAVTRDIEWGVKIPLDDEVGRKEGVRLVRCSPRIPHLRQNLVGADSGGIGF